MDNPYKGIYPGLSTLLNMLYKPGLEKFKTQIGIEANKERNQKAIASGNKLHTAIDAIKPKKEKVKTDKPKIEKIVVEKQPELDLPLRRFNEWSEEYIAEWLCSEQEIVNHDIGYLGRLDKVGLTKTGELVVVEVKRTKRIHREHVLQVVGYMKSELIEINEKLDDKTTGIILRYDEFTTQWKPTYITKDQVVLGYECLRGLKNLWTFSQDF